LEEIGFLKEHKIRILGTSLRQYRTFYHQADQKSFLQDLGYQVPSSSLVSTVREAIEFSEQIQFPIVVWPLASKHGQGRRIANNLDDLCDAVENGLEVSPQGQCLLEFSTVGFKELEYIVVRDRQDNYYLAGNIESVDPVGIHSSDSYQVIPSLTLTDTEHQALREAALSIVRHLRLVGATSIKFALDPKSYQFYILEVNPFASDSFSTMSMALGYSIYHQALCLKLGDHLLDLPHPTMKGLTALFEPTLDRILFKLPVFPIEKVSRVLNTQIHSISALYGFGTSLEEAYQQAVENFGSDQWPKNILKDISDDELIQRIAKRMPYRFSSILEEANRLLVLQAERKRIEKKYTPYTVFDSYAASQSASKGDLVWFDQKLAYDLALWIHTDSLEPKYPKGSVALIKQTFYDTAGAIYAIEYDGQTLIKRVFREAQGIRLVSLNKKYSDKVIPLEEEPRVIGKVIASFLPAKEDEL
jgi:carbamoyl-phosphate synthase large subunit